VPEEELVVQVVDLETSIVKEDQPRILQGAAASSMVFVPLDDIRDDAEAIVRRLREVAGEE
jgi:hypothetical protein